MKRSTQTLFSPDVLIIEACGLVVILFAPVIGMLVVGIGFGMGLERDLRTWRDRNGRV